jgi:DNA replication protein DnaC
MKNNDCMYNKICLTECSVDCKRFIETDFLIKTARIPKSLAVRQKITVVDSDNGAFESYKRIADRIDEFVSSGQSLYLFSKTTGNGKTTMATQLLLKYFNSIWLGNGLKQRGLFVRMPDLALMFKDFKGETEYTDIKQELRTVDLVVFDDIGANKCSEYENQQFLNVLDERIVNGKSNIYTGNLTTAELSVLGVRTASRIKGGTVLELKGADRRGKGKGGVGIWR